MALKLYKIDIAECGWTAMAWAVSPEKALKDAAKIQFERRGRTHFQFKDRQFVNATALVNWGKKTNQIEAWVKEQTQVP